MIIQRETRISAEEKQEFINRGRIRSNVVCTYILYGILFIVLRIVIS